MQPDASPSPQLLQEVHRIHIRTRHLVESALLGAYRSAFKGKGREVEDVREFQEGDEQRSVDWNVTARMNTPYVKTYREERALTVMLLVDISASSQFGTGLRTKSSLIAEIGALIALSTIGNQDQVGLLLFSGQVEKYIPPAKGQRHALRVIRELLTAKPTHPGSDLEQALTFLSRLHSKPAICFLISDFLPSAESHPLKLASRRYDCIAIRVLDPRELTLPKVGLLNLRDLESGQDVLIDSSSAKFQEHFNQNTESDLQQQDLLFKRLGIGLIDLRTHLPYSEAMRKYFEARSRRIK